MAMHSSDEDVCCESGAASAACCIPHDAAAELRKVERSLLFHSGGVSEATVATAAAAAAIADDCDAEEATEAAEAALDAAAAAARRRLFGRGVDREAEVRAWAAAERRRSPRCLGDEAIDEGRLLTHAVAATFYVVAFEAEGAVLLRMHKNKVQVFRVRSLPGRCLRTQVAGRTGVELETTLLPWRGHAVCLGCGGGGYSMRLRVADLLPLQRAYAAASLAGTVLATLLPKAERTRYAAACKERGNAAFKAKELRAAAAHYEAGLRAGGGTAAAADLHSNAALMRLRLAEPHAALRCCDAGLRADAGHAKCAYRRSQALAAMGLAAEAAAAAERFAAAHPGKSAEELRRIVAAEAPSAAANNDGGKSGPWPRLLGHEAVAGCLAGYLTQRDAAVVGRVSRQARVALAASATSLSLRGRLVSVEALPLQRVASLSLVECRGVDDRAVQVVLAQCRQLTDLCLRGCAGVTGASVDRLLEHCRTQLPPRALMSSLRDLPPLPGVVPAAATAIPPPAFSPFAAAAAAAAAADGGGSPPRPSRLRRARHHEALSRCGADGGGARVLLRRVDLARCDAVAPSEALDALAATVELRATCRAADFSFAQAGERLWVVSAEGGAGRGSEPDADGRFLHFNGEAAAAAGFAAAPMGVFALQTELSVDDARSALERLGLWEGGGSAYSLSG